MTERRRFQAGRGTLLAALALVFSLTGHHAGHAAPASRIGAGRSGAFIESGGNSAPESAPRRLVTETDKASGSGPALWIGVVMGISGLVGLFYSLWRRTPAEDG